MAHIGTDIVLAKQFLEKGEVVAIPTETVYGLAANAYDAKAVSRIFDIKKRPKSNPLIIHIGSIDQLTHLVSDVPPLAAILAQHYWPGPLTLLLPKKTIVSDLVTAGTNMVAVRIPNHPRTLQLLQTLSFPLAAPSANPFGYVSPTTSEHVCEQLGDQIPYILDGGSCVVGIESTIVGFKDDKLTIYRLGGIEIALIEKIINSSGLVNQTIIMPDHVEKLILPGSSLHHYAPVKSLKLGHVPTLLAAYSQQKIGILAFDQYYEGVDKAHQILLTPCGSLEEAAHNLFAALRKLDQLPIEVIVCSKVPQIGLGMAINDRLIRASVRR